ncbi:MAG: protoporphyrinogen oxidase [Verrucomicrobiae bacterium]|nr:protoporphyrinogen oxidase [Verrucomicrobiae bacterium]
MASTQNHPFIVIGAGVSGLAAAVTLRRRGIDPLVLEAQSHVGGASHSESQSGYLVESGPNTMLLSNPDTAAFLKENDLLDKTLDAAPQAKNRFVVRNGKPLALPTSPFDFFQNPVLSWPAKLRLCLEPFIPRGNDSDETLADFVRRRMGTEPLRELVGPFVSGVYAGDPERLIVRHALPKLYRLEQDYGSLILGSIRKGGGSGPKGRLVSWAGGYSELTASLASQLGDRIRLSCPVQTLRRKTDGFELETPTGPLHAKQVIVATDAAHASRLVSPLIPETSALEHIHHPPLLVLHLGFPRSQVSHPLNGFGVLISRARGLRTLGALFSSTLFPHRAPEGQVLLTAFIGGAYDLGVLELDDSDALRVAMDDLSPLLGLRGQPSFHRITRWPQAIPQYEIDHPKTIAACEKAEAALPGLYLLGNYRGGISSADCLANGYKLGRTSSMRTSARDP